MESFRATCDREKQALHQFTDASKRWTAYGKDTLADLPHHRWKVVMLVPLRHQIDPGEAFELSDFKCVVLWSVWLDVSHKLFLGIVKQANISFTSAILPCIRWNLLFIFPVAYILRCLLYPWTKPKGSWGVQRVHCLYYTLSLCAWCHASLIKAYQSQADSPIHMICATCKLGPNGASGSP